MPAYLLIVALLCNYAPEVLVSIGAGTLAAWFVVFDGVQIACLWWAIGIMTEMLATLDHSKLHAFVQPTLAVCCYGIFEAIQTPICRLSFPMSVAPPRHPEGVCGAAGLPTYQLSPLLIALCAVAIARTLPGLTGAQTHRA